MECEKMPNRIGLRAFDPVQMISGVIQYTRVYKNFAKRASAEPTQAYMKEGPDPCRDRQGADLEADQTPRS